VARDLPRPEDPADAAERAESLVATKLRAPSLPRWLLPRRRLVSQLDDAIETGVVLVSAPAGFGKTMAVAEWAATLQEPLGWLSLDEADSDPIRFWRYVVAAIERASPGASQRIGRSPPEVSSPSTPSSRR